MVLFAFLMVCIIIGVVVIALIGIAELITYLPYIFITLDIIVFVKILGFIFKKKNK